MKIHWSVVRATVMLLPVVFPMDAVADLILDQTSLPAPLNAFSSFAGSVQQAQTFQVGITGVLAQLDITGISPFGGSFFLDIRGQTASHPDNAVVLETVIVGGLTGGGVTAIPLNLPVTANELLAFVVYGGVGAQLSGSINSSYDRGGLWTFGNPPLGVDGPGTWFPNCAGPYNIDLAFSTFVDVSVPEPATLWLLAGGATVVAIWPRKQKRRRLV